LPVFLLFIQTSQNTKTKNSNKTKVKANETKVKQSESQTTPSLLFLDLYQVLNCLQRLDEASFPMTDYIIHLKQEDSHPVYLTEVDPNYARRPKSVPSINVVGKGNKKFEFNVLNFQEWPNAEQLGLDCSQYTALQSALTKELAVVQGPPGTGKTFMALKITEILITNKQRLGIKRPILVISLTNHALDQFLAGMLKFTKNLVRIGGQSKSPELEQFTLKSIRIPQSQHQRHLKTLLDDARNELQKNQFRLEDINCALEFEGILIDPMWQRKNVGFKWLVGSPLGKVFTTLKSNYISFKDLWKLLRRSKEDTKDKKEKGRSKKEANRNNWFLTNELIHLENNFKSFKESYAGKELEYQFVRPPWQIKYDEEKLQCYTQLLSAEKWLLEKKVLDLTSKIKDRSNELYEVKNMEKIEHLCKQDVIGLTTTGAARLHQMLDSIGCRIG
jgi:hypothetical protein